MGFWKRKKDDLGLGDSSKDFGLGDSSKDFGLGGKNDFDLGLPPLDTPGTGATPSASQNPAAMPNMGFDDQGMMEHQPLKSTQPPIYPEPGHDIHSEEPRIITKDDGSGMKMSIELMLAKLDAIKSELDSVNQRLMRIERIADEESSKAAAQKKIW